MDQTWLYYSANMHIMEGLHQRATNGALGVNNAQELILFNNKNEEIARGPVKDIVGKFGFWNNSVKIGGRNFRLEFHPLAQNFGGVLGAAGAVIAGASNASMVDDQRSESQKRDELKQLFAQIQGSAQA
jgi:hypothetical protein